MHIIAILAALLSGIAVWSSRIKLMRDVAGESGLLNRGLATAPRRMALRR
jgi:hypothetical protein